MSIFGCWHPFGKQRNMDFITNNLEWIFGGIGVPVVVYLFRLGFKKITSDNNQSSQVNNLIIHNNIADTSHADQLSSSADETTKSMTRILFIDDQHTDFKMVSILKKSGWINTKSVKDITDLDDPKINEADIIFVDINGVGASLFQDQGLGLASALKKKHKKKKIVIYSAETTGDRFHKALREVDGCLYKDAEPYQFINLIEGFQSRR